MRCVLAIAVMLAWTNVSFAAHGRHHVDHRYPGYGASQARPANTWRSWIEQQRYLDPCHCSDGI
jgi:hypothetical protein